MIRIAYIKNNDIPEIKILDKNLMIYDGQKISINSYLEKIKNYLEKIKDPNYIEHDLIDDNKYDNCACGKPNEYFCEICNKNICNKCKDNCYYTKNHSKIRSLDEIKNAKKEKIDKIKEILKKYIVPIKVEEINLTNEIKYDKEKSKIS